jgi:hypothetical protein
MQIPPGQISLPPNPTPPTLALPVAERAQAIEPARKVTAGREGSELAGKPKGRAGASSTSKPHRDDEHRGYLLDLMV